MTVPQIITGQRFAALVPNWREAAADAPEIKRIDLVAATDAPVDFGGFREVLAMDGAEIDTSAARTLLLNHDPAQVAGRIDSITCEGGTMRCSADIMPGAKLATGVSVAEAVDFGALRGVSIGYNYSRNDAEYNDQTRTVTVRKWRLLEVSLTPIPADTSGQVRSLPFPPAIPATETTMVDSNTPAGQPAAPAHATDEGHRAAVLSEQREIAVRASSLGLDAAAYVGLSAADASSKMLADLAAKRQTSVPAAPAVSVSVDEADKRRDAVSDAMAARVFGASPAAGNPYAGRSLTSLARRYAMDIGIRGAEDWERKDVAHFILGEMSQVRGGRDAANVTSSNFANFVMASVITKVVAKGFETGASSVRYQPLVERQTVPDFRQFTIGGLGVGNLQKTAENVAFPELAKAEGYFNSAAKMWGGTISLTLQALINDDTAQFDRALRNAGVIAQKTIDKRVFQKLLMGTSTAETVSTWTSNTTSGGSLVYTTADAAAAVRGRVGAVRAGLMNKIGLSGDPLGTMPKFLVCGPTREQEAIGAVTSVAPGQITAPGVVGGLQVVASPWLEASSLTGYSTTSYYLLADPMEATGLVLSTIGGYEAPQVQEYDAGAIGARNWKIWMPFEVDLFNFTNAAGTVVIPAAQQATT